MHRALLIASAHALVKDTCQPGSDTACTVFGIDMCCAHIQYTYQLDTQVFYGCASRNGIEYSNGNILDGFGYSGNWFCANAVSLAAPLTLTFILSSVL